MTSSRLPPAAAAVLLLAGGVAGVGWVVLPDAHLVHAAAGALLAAGGVATALVGVGAARRPLLQIPVCGVLVAVATQRLIATGGEAAAWGAAGGIALLLVWATVALGPGAALRLSPVLTVAHAAAIASTGDTLGFVAVSPAAALAVELVAWPWRVVRGARRDRRLALRGIDALVVAGDDLRTADPSDVGERVCRLAAELTGAAGALLYVEGPGRVVVAGRHGSHPAPRPSELAGDRDVVAVLRGAPLGPGDPLLVPLVGESGVVGVVAVHRPRLRVDHVLGGLLALFGGEAGGALERMSRSGLGLSAGEVDPVTGVGNRHQASKVVAGLRPGDGLVVLEVEALRNVRRTQGEQAGDLLLGQMGLHLRNSTRPGDAIARLGDDEFVIVLRELKAPVDVVIRRVAEAWLRMHPGRTINVGAALHLEGQAPIDTLERAQSALAARHRQPDEWAARVGA